MPGNKFQAFSSKIILMHQTVYLNITKNARNFFGHTKQMSKTYEPNAI